MSFQGHRSISRHDGSTQDAWYTYVCGHCGTKVSGAVVASYRWQDKATNWYFTKWLLCTNCTKGSVENDEIIFPGATFGPEVKGLPAEIEEAYYEARQCMEVNSFTAAELICRKILMHVAVEKGAKEGETFASYLSYLQASGYVTPPMMSWVDLIRKHGNESTHQISKPDQKRAESTVMFTAELLRIIYEMEFMAKQYVSP